MSNFKLLILLTVIGHPCLRCLSVASLQLVHMDDKEFGLRSPSLQLQDAIDRLDDANHQERSDV